MISFIPEITKSEFFSNLENGYKELSSPFLSRVFNYLSTQHIRIIFDIGANFGVYTERFLQFPEVAEVHAFEPDSLNFKILQHNFSSKDGVFLYNCGIYYGISEGQVVGTGDNNPGGYMLADAALSHSGHWGDRLCLYDDKVFKLKPLEEIAVERIDLIKIDVEGSEYNILSKSIALQDARYLLVEFHNHPEEYIRHFIDTTLPNFKVIELSNEISGDPFYWHSLLENKNENNIIF